MKVDTPTGKLRVFISYSRRDSAAADAIVAALETCGFEVKIDKRDLPFGEEWQKELADFIRISDTVIWLVSEHSISSQWVNWELDEVKARNKRLVPVMVGHTADKLLPRQLGTIHILPQDRVFEVSLDMTILVDVLETDQAWLKQASRLQDRAAEWISKGRANGLLLSRAALTDSERWKDAQPPKAPPPSDEIRDLMFASQRQSAKQQRWWVTFCTAIAFAALSLTGLAVWQWTVATDYAGVSQQGVDEMVFTIVRTVRDERGISNSTALRMLNTADRVVDKMSASAWDPAWQHRRIAIFAEFADLFEVRGDAGNQVVFSRKALDGALSMVAKHPREAGFRRALWVARGKVADGLANTGDTVGALIEWNKALLVIQALSMENTSNVRWQRDVAVTFSRIGAIELNLKRHANALDSFRECLAIRLRLAQSDSENPDLQRELALCHGNIGDVLMAMGRFAEAADGYKAEIAITSRRAQSLPGNMDAQFRLSVSLERLGKLYHQRKHAESALEHIEQCGKIRQMLIETDPGNVEWKKPCGQPDN